jgi:Tfp pilus assembly protein PilV
MTNKAASQQQPQQQQQQQQLQPTAVGTITPASTSSNNSEYNTYGSPCPSTPTNNRHDLIRRITHIDKQI